jgi:arginine repressor
MRHSCRTKKIKYIMEEQEILSQVVEIFKDELDNEEIELTMESTAKDSRRLGFIKSYSFNGSN